MTSDAVPSAHPRWYGPRVVGTAAIALAMTAPGQTAAISTFVDPLIEGLDIGRSTISTAYLIGTLVGAAALPYVGRSIDRYGPRRVLIAIAFAFGAVLMALSAVSGIVGLTAGFVGIRMLGQGSLSLTATTTVAIYIRRRRGLAQGIATSVGAAGISLAPLILEGAVSEYGFRTVWFVEGLIVWAVVIPFALVVLPGRPSRPATDDAAAASAAASALPPVDWTRRQAMRTGIFWVIAAGVTVMATLGTAMTFHQISLLGERGLTPSEAAATFLPLMIAGLAATLLVGYLADRVADRVLIIGALSTLTLALVMAAFASPGLSAVGYGIALGAAMNSFHTIEAVAFPHCFGLGHLGSIRGIVHTFSVAGSAFGPLLLALGHSWADSYRPIVLAFTVVPLTAICFAAVVKRPPPHPDQLEPRIRRRRSRSDTRAGS